MKPAQLIREMHMKNYLVGFSHIPDHEVKVKKKAVPVQETSENLAIHSSLPFLVHDRAEFNQDQFVIDRRKKFKQKRIDRDLSIDFPQHRDIDFVETHTKGFIPENQDLIRFYLRMYESNKFHFKEIRKNKKSKQSKELKPITEIKQSQGTSIVTPRQQMLVVKQSLKDLAIQERLLNKQVTLPKIAEKIEVIESVPELSLMNLNSDIIPQARIYDGTLELEQLMLERVVKSIKDNVKVTKEELQRVKEIVQRRKQAMTEMERQLQLQELLYIKSNIYLKVQNSQLLPEEQNHPPFDPQLECQFDLSSIQQPAKKVIYSKIPITKVTEYQFNNYKGEDTFNDHSIIKQQGSVTKINKNREDSLLLEQESTEMLSILHKSASIPAIATGQISQQVLSQKMLDQTYNGLTEQSLQQKRADSKSSNRRSQRKSEIRFNDLYSVPVQKDSKTIAESSKRSESKNEQSKTDQSKKSKSRIDNKSIQSVKQVDQQSDEDIEIDVEMKQSDFQVNFDNMLDRMLEKKKQLRQLNESSHSQQQQVLQQEVEKLAQNYAEKLLSSISEKAKKPLMQYYPQSSIVLAEEPQKLEKQKSVTEASAPVKVPYERDTEHLDKTFTLGSALDLGEKNLSDEQVRQIVESVKLKLQQSKVSPHQIQRQITQLLQQLIKPEIKLSLENSIDETQQKKSKHVFKDDSSSSSRMVKPSLTNMTQAEKKQLFDSHQMKLEARTNLDEMDAEMLQLQSLVSKKSIVSSKKKVTSESKDISEEDQSVSKITRIKKTQRTESESNQKSKPKISNRSQSEVKMTSPKQVPGVQLDHVDEDLNINDDHSENDEAGLRSNRSKLMMKSANLQDLSKSKSELMQKSSRSKKTDSKDQNVKIDDENNGQVVDEQQNQQNQENEDNEQSSYEDEGQELVDQEQTNAGELLVGDVDQNPNQLLLPQVKLIPPPKSHRSKQKSSKGDKTEELAQLLKQEPQVDQNITQNDNFDVNGQRQFVKSSRTDQQNAASLEILQKQNVDPNTKSPRPADQVYLPKNRIQQKVAESKLSLGQVANNTSLGQSSKSPDIQSGNALANIKLLKHQSETLGQTPQSISPNEKKPTQQQQFPASSKAKKGVSGQQTPINKDSKLKVPVKAKPSRFSDAVDKDDNEDYSENTSNNQSPSNLKKVKKLQEQKKKVYDLKVEYDLINKKNWTLRELKEDIRRKINSMDNPDDEARYNIYLYEQRQKQVASVQQHIDGIVADKRDNAQECSEIIQQFHLQRFKYKDVLEKDKELKFTDQIHLDEQQQTQIQTTTHLDDYMKEVQQNIQRMIQQAQLEQIRDNVQYRKDCFNQDSELIREMRQISGIKQGPATQVILEDAYQTDNKRYTSNKTHNSKHSIVDKVEKFRLMLEQLKIDNPQRYQEVIKTQISEPLYLHSTKFKHLYD